MRDYKFQKTDWPTSKPKQPDRWWPIVIKVGSGLLAMALGAAFLQWVLIPHEEKSKIPSDPRIVPLTIPPKSSEPEPPPSPEKLNRSALPPLPSGEKGED